MAGTHREKLKQLVVRSADRKSLSGASAHPDGGVTPFRDGLRSPRARRAASLSSAFGEDPLRSDGPAAASFPAPRASLRSERRPPTRALSMGGASTVQPPLAIMLYRVKRGDTISGIATKLGLDTDTISTFNRSGRSRGAQRDRGRGSCGSRARMGSTSRSTGISTRCAARTRSPPRTCWRPIP